MTIYVVAESEFDHFGSSFRGVFSTQAKAEAFVHRETYGDADDWVIVACDVDEGYVPTGALE